MMKKPSMTMPDWMLDAIEDRREKGESRSEYVRDALARRFEQEDEGNWIDPTGQNHTPENTADD